MKENLPRISQATDMRDIHSCLEENYNALSIDWYLILDKWMYNSYSVFKDHEKYLKHEKIENLAGLEIELVYEWELGSMLIFDRTNLHCSSSKIEGKKIGLTTFTKR